jgi:hypothetical protein
MVVVVVAVRTILGRSRLTSEFLPLFSTPAGASRFAQKV